MKMIYLFIFLPMLTCCKDEHIDYIDFLPSSNIEPIIDGKQEEIWFKTQPNNLYLFFGQEAEDSLDFKATYKVLQYAENMFFFISVYDQIKYTHPKPTNKYDLKLWNPTDYDKVKLEFHINNNVGDNYIISLNYGLDSIFTSNITPKDIKAVLSETPLGYNTEFMIPLKFFKEGIITFNLFITDHDKRFHKEGFDVYGRYESLYGAWGQYRKNKNF